MGDSVLACDDETLKQRITAGDGEALDALFRCSKDALTRYLRSRCGDATDADDALQNTFENATRFLEGYRGDASPRGWLFRVAANACTRMRRGKKNAASLHFSIDDRELIDAASPDPEARMTSRADAVFGAIAKLEPTDRAIILLRDGDGLSAKETAAKLGLTEAAVKSRLFRARQHVRAAAEE
jgi:RNA polymerase sigma-70 factor (ECF subfamily)